ncbi:hypothetical protein HYX18_00370 [Candidatus Woesearchaeota archaeon]|nr:hypothetical protein [Candidatus Woesearchaeota archaeon]
MDKKSVFYTLLVIFIVVLIGYLGYKYGFLGFIYDIAMPGSFSKFNIILLSIIFGIAAFFSPCAFTVMPAFVSNYISKSSSNKGIKAIKLGLLAALGVIIVDIIIGLIVAIFGAAAPFSKDPRTDIPIILFIRALIGLIIAVMGVMILLRKSINLPIIQKIFSKLGQIRNPTKNMFWYGLFYNGAAIGCTGPILLGLMLYAFSLGSFSVAFLSFFVFALTMGLLMLILTLLTAYFQETIMRKFVVTSMFTKYVAGVIMIVVGLSIFLLTLEGNNIFVRLFFPYLK